MLTLEASRAAQAYAAECRLRNAYYYTAKYRSKAKDDAGSALEWREYESARDRSLAAGVVMVDALLAVVEAAGSCYAGAALDYLRAKLHPVVIPHTTDGEEGVPF